MLESDFARLTCTMSHTFLYPIASHFHLTILQVIDIIGSWVRAGNKATYTLYMYN